MKSKQILVVQTATLGVIAFCELAEKYGLKRDVDFTALGSIFSVEEAVFNNDPQLLIIGSAELCDRDSDFRYLIMDLWDKNPQLVIVGYSSLPLKHEYFDRMIRKDFDKSDAIVMATIADFREGRLRRMTQT